MQAIILAAGMGKRLKELTNNNTKCMVEVNGVKLIDRMLGQLSKLGLSKAVLVTGYQGQKLRDYVGTSVNGMPIDYIDNPIYDKTNNIYSLALASNELLKDDTLLLESDLIVEDAVLQKVIRDPHPNVACVDAFKGWMDGTVVTLGEDNSIKQFIPKREFVYAEIPSYYKTVNIYKFSREFSESHYVPFLKAYSQALGNNEYYEQVLRVIALIDKPVMYALPLSGEKWYEIDDLQDLDIAESMFCPPEEQIKKLSSRCGGYWRYPGLKDFCYLVNPYYPSKRLRAEMMQSFNELLEDYPSGMHVNSLLAAKTFGLHQNQILVGNGAAELIKVFMERTEGKIGFVYPTFDEYPNRISEDRRVIFTPSSPGFRYTAEDLIGFFKDKGLSVLVLVNPDNPSGNILTEPEIIGLAAWAYRNGIRLLVDESFIDFADQPYTCMKQDFLQKYPTACVMKSISKSYGVPGIRLGVFASNDATIIAAMKAAVAIWNINSFGEFFLQICEKYHDEYAVACRELAKERSRFMAKLRTISFLTVYPSEANYVLCEVKAPFDSKGLTVALWKKAELLIKDCAGKRGFGGKSFIRLAVRDTADNDALIAALERL